MGTVILRNWNKNKHSIPLSDIALRMTCTLFKMEPQFENNSFEEHVIPMCARVTLRPIYALENFNESEANKFPTST